MPDGSPAFIDAALIIGSSVLLSLLVLWIVRWTISHDRLTPHNEVSGFVYAVVGVIYAVILGFAVISVWEDFTTAEANANAEANAAGNIYRVAGGLPEPSRQTIQQSVLAYANTVVDEEWPAMAERSGASATAVEHVDRLWDAFYLVELTTPDETELYAEGLDQLDQLTSLRQERLEASDGGLLGIMWGVMIVGASLTVLYPCLFGVESGLVHSLIIAILSATLGLLLFLAYDFNHPFHGDVHVEPEGFTRVIEQFTVAAQPILVTHKG